MTTIMNKINNDQIIGPSMYKDNLYKFQQLDNTMDLLNEQIKDLNNLYYSKKKI